MRIALLHYSAPPVVGGVESVLGQHARLMAEAGHAVRVIAGRGGEIDRQVEFVRIPLVDSRHPAILDAKSSLDRGEVPGDFEDLVTHVEAALSPVLADRDLLIAHNVCSLHKNLALTSALRRMVQTPSHPSLILWHHDLAWTTSRYAKELHPGYPWDLLRTKFPTARQVAISELRQQELADLLRIPKDEVIVVPNGIDVATFLKLEPITRGLYQQLDLASAGPILLLPARITRRKNIELALRVLAVLRETHSRALLLVTGPLGPHNPTNAGYAAELRALREELGLQNAVHFLADVAGTTLSDAVVADFYRLADALFFPSREEGFGIPVLEAGLANLPIFCADIRPLRKLGGKDAQYFSPDADPRTVASLVAEYFAADSHLALRWRVRREYTWEGVYQQHIEPLLRGEPAHAQPPGRV